MKTLLVYVNGTPSDRSVLACALSVARLFGAHLDCLHVVPDRRSLLGRAVNVDLSSAMLLTDALRTLEAEAQKRLAHARNMFFAFCEDENLAVSDTPSNAGLVSASWREQDGKPAVVLSAQGRFHDLIVMDGGARRDLLFSSDDVGDVIMSAGRPVLLTAHDRHINVKSVAIAWKDCAEAARAVSAALPILAKAERIIVFGACEPGTGVEVTTQSLNNITDHLRWHGFNAERFRVVPGSRTVPDAIFEHAAESGAGLLAMGGFGQGRLRELVFGGFTQRVLDGAQLPVLIFH